MSATSSLSSWKKPFSMPRAVFLDRDGVINRKAATEGEYVTSWEHFEILPGVAEAISGLNSADFQVIVVTNQRAISKGLMTTGDLERIHLNMCHSLSEQGAKIDAVYYCPHGTEPRCACRKPEPGMLFQAAREHKINLSESWMVGDSERDVEAGRRAGCRTIRLAGNRESERTFADLVSSSLLEAVQLILTFHSNSEEASPGKGSKAW